MRDLDETGLEILQLLVSDARRPWAEIADVVDPSPPAVADRIDRLQELGVIRRFTVDRSLLRDGVPVLLTVEPADRTVDELLETIRAAEAVEHVFRTAENDLVCYARIPRGDVPSWLDDVVGPDAVADYEVTLLTGGEWTPTVDGTELALTCAECGNTVTSEGQFRSRYERFDAGVDESA